MAEASMDGGYLCRDVSVSPMNGGRNPFAKARFRVEMAGENRVACAKATKSAGVLVWWLMTGAAVAVYAGRVVVPLVSPLGWSNVSGNNQRPCVLRGHVIAFPSGSCMVQHL